MKNSGVVAKKKWQIYKTKCEKWKITILKYFTFDTRYNLDMYDVFAIYHMHIYYV